MGKWKLQWHQLKTDKQLIHQNFVQIPYRWKYLRKVTPKWITKCEVSQTLYNNWLKLQIQHKERKTLSRRYYIDYQLISNRQLIHKYWRWKYWHDPKMKGNIKDKMVAQPKDQFSTLISFDLSQVLELIVQLQSLDLLYFQQYLLGKNHQNWCIRDLSTYLSCVFLQQELSCY